MLVDKSNEGQTVKHSDQSVTSKQNHRANRPGHEGHESSTD